MALDWEVLGKEERPKENQCCNCKEIKADHEFEVFGDSNEKTLCIDCADKIMTADRSWPINTEI